MGMCSASNKGPKIKKNICFPMFSKLFDILDEYSSLVQLKTCLEIRFIPVLWITEPLCGLDKSVGW